MGQKRHALHGPHSDVQRAGYIHRHGSGYGNWMGDVHRCRGRDVHRGDVDWPSNGDRVLKAHWRRDVHSVGANVHLCRDGDGVVNGVSPVQCRGDGGRYGHGGSRVADFTAFITRVEVGLAVGLQMAGDVGSTQHLSTNATSDFSFVSDHVGSKSVFGGKSRGTGCYLTFEWPF